MLSLRHLAPPGRLQVQRQVRRVPTPLLRLAWFSPLLWLPEPQY